MGLSLNVDPDNPLASQELVSYTRPAFFNEQTGKETALPSDFAIPVLDPDPCCTDEIFNVPFGAPEFFFGTIHTYPEIISDTVIFAKNLTRFLFPKSPATWTSYVGWSGSGRAAVTIDSNVRGGGFQVFSSTGPQMGGGNYNIWGNPVSGLRYDAFVSYAGANDSHGYMTQGFFQSDVNSKIPHLSALCVARSRERCHLASVRRIYVCEQGVARARRARAGNRSKRFHPYLFASQGNASGREISSSPPLIPKTPKVDSGTTLSISSPTPMPSTPSAWGSASPIPMRRHSP